MLRPTCRANMVQLAAKFRQMGTDSKRGYPEALEKLSLLAANRRVTALFEAPSPTSPGSSTAAEKQSVKPRQHLNAAAIPEMLTWLRRAGYSPQDLSRMRHIHVAGTKGKGSVCAYATAMLCRYRGAGAVGTYTSPHLVSPRERIAINGTPVAQDVFAEAFFELWDRFAESSTKMETGNAADKPFYFRFLTILAWHIFLKQGVTDVVMEVGIGGEFDATNVLPPEAVSAAVVTQLGIDHVAMLGDTVEEIAWHKAGIFKRRVPAVTLRLDEQPEVMEVLRSRAVDKGARLVELDRAAIARWGGVGDGVRGFQVSNQALAVAAVREHLGIRGDPLDAVPGDMVQGLRDAKLRGRCEVVQDGNGRTTWMLDGAHTVESLEEVARWLVASLDEGPLGETAVLVFNQQERDAAELLQVLLRAVGEADAVFSHVILTRNELDAASETRDLSVQKRAAERLSTLWPGIPVSVVDNLPEAVAEARNLSTQAESGRHKVLVTGSLHLVGGVLRILEPASLL